MKKQYVKPMIAVEYYELTQAIAACDIKIGFLDSECVLKDPDANHYMKDFANIGMFIEKCEIEGKGMDDQDGICYHTNANAAFNS